MASPSGPNDVGTERKYESDAPISAGLPQRQPSLPFQLNSMYMYERQESNGSWGANEDWDSANPFSEEGQDLRDATITEEIKSAADEDCMMLSMIDRFKQCRIDYPGGSRIRVRMTLPLSYLQISQEQAKAWSLDLNKVFIVDIEFPSTYVSSSIMPTVTVGQAQSNNHKLEPFLMSSTIAFLVRSIFKSPMPVLPPKPYSMSLVHQVMDLTSCDFSVALAALELHEYKRDRAVQHLLVDKNKVQLVRQTSTEQIAAMNNKKQAFRERDTSTLSELQQKLMLKYQVSPQLIRLAMSLGSNEQGVHELLSDEKMKQELLVICKEDEDETFLFACPKLQTEKKETVVDDQQSEEIDPSACWKDGGRSSGIPIEEIAIAAELQKYSHIVRAMLFAETVLMQANKYCLVCCKPMEFSGVKPAICNRALCKTAVEDFGVGFDIVSELRDNPELVDLLITFAYSACMAGSLHFVVPINVSAEDSSQVDGSGKRKIVTFKLEGEEAKKAQTAHDAKNAGKVKLEDESYMLNVPRMQQCMQLCPSVKDLQTHAAKGLDVLISELNKLDILLYPLIRWVLTSSRAHLRLLTNKEKIVLPGFAVDHQFVMMSTPPEREAVFRKLRKASEITKGKGKGSIYAWHGSSTCNWHAIVRTGLKNLSNTALMTTGAAYGEGIYMATEANTSHDYCKTQDGWKNSMFGAKSKCLALCEVINHPKLKPPNPYYVVQEEEFIITRYFFVCAASNRFATVAMDMAPHLPKLQ